MKKTLLLCVAVPALFINHAASAQEQTENTVWSGFTGFFSPDWKKDFSATVGVKLWINEWRRDSFFRTSPFFTDGLSVEVLTRDSKPNAQTSDSVEATPIPQLGLRYKWLFLTGSYYSKTDFDFGTTTRSAIIIVNDVTRLNQTLLDSASAERYEWDGQGGVYMSGTCCQQIDLSGVIAHKLSAFY